MTQAIDDLAIIVSASTQQLAGDLRQAARMIESFQKQVKESTPPPPKPPTDTKPHRLAGRAVEHVGASARSAAADLAAMAGQAAMTGGTMVALELGISGVAGAFQHLKESVNLAAELEGNTLAFEVMLKDARAATEILGEIRKYAASTPFNNRELTAASRQLIAYGVAADQVIPTLKMLGDVSAAFGKDLPIRDLTYLYGTLYAQQRAYAVDVRQFAGRGIPIYEELSKVVGKSVSEVKELTEEGRISSREVTQAFINMTSAGGRFEGMTKRQGQTLVGVWEQANDAFQMAKLGLGQIVVEETKLKDALRDLEGFAGRLRSNLDGLRPAVRFAGDLAKAGAQISYEFGKASVAIAAMNVEGFDRAFPGLKEARESFLKIIEDAKNFRMDKAEVINFGLALGESIALSLARVGHDLADLGRGLVRGVVAPIVRGAAEARDLIRDAATWLQGINDASNGAKFLIAPIAGIVAQLTKNRGPVAESMLDGRRDRDELPTADKVLPPVPGMSADRILREYEILNQGIEYRRKLALQYPSEATRKWYESRRQRREEFLAAFDSPEEARKHLPTGGVPPLRGGAGSVHAPDPTPPWERALQDMERVAGMFDQPDTKIHKTFADLRSQMIGGIESSKRLARVREDLAREMEGKRLADESARFVRWLQDRQNLARNETAGMAAAGGAFGSLLSQMPRPATALPPAPVPAEAKVKLPEVFPHLEELARTLNKEFGDPTVELNKFKKDLDDARGMIDKMTGKPLISEDIANRAWVDHVQKEAQRHGAGGHYQLPDAVTVGTAEDAAVISRWKTGNERSTVEDLLQQMVDLQKIANERAAGLIRAVAPPPRPVNFPAP